MEKANDPIIIATNRELRPWEEMLVETIKASGEVESAMNTEVDYACVATRMKDGHVMTGYCNAECFELAETAAHIFMDAVDKFVEANFERYMQKYEEETEEEEEEEYDGIETDLS